VTVAVGDVVEWRLPEGYAYGLVVLCPAAYPPAIAFLRDLVAAPLADPRAALEGAETVTAMVPLPGRDEEGLSVVGRLPRVPEVRFRLPVRDRSGRVLYSWEWDGQSIELGDDARSAGLPERRILPKDELAAFLQSAEKLRRPSAT